jgi:short-subunit dehydrogenase
MSRPVCLVTGASAGIGRELARQAAADGHDLVLVARRRERLEELGAELTGAHGGTAHVVPADLADPAAPAAIAAELADKGVEVDVLVNNAGFGSNGRFHELDLSWELKMVQVNIAAQVALTGHFLPGMVQRGRGRVLNIASTAAFQPGPKMATYYATKAFVLSWSQAVAVELQGTGVTLTVHCPGATLSEFTDVAGTGKTRLFTTQQAPSAAEVARHAWAATKRGERVAIHGFANKVGALGARMSPAGIAMSVAQRLNEEG